MGNGFIIKSRKSKLKEIHESDLMKSQIDLDSVINEKDSIHKVETLANSEIESAFPRGPSAWMKFLNKNFRYPERAQSRGSQGTVDPSFYC